jgi:hypothetical protein
MLSEIVPPAQRVGVVLVIVGAAGIAFTVTATPDEVVDKLLAVTITVYVPDCVAVYEAEVAPVIFVASLRH